MKNRSFLAPIASVIVFAFVLLLFAQNTVASTANEDDYMASASAHISNLDHTNRTDAGKQRDLTQSFSPASLPFHDGFESGTLGGEWQIETTNDGRVVISDTYPYSGTYSLHLDDSVNDSSKSTAAAILTLDLTGQSEIELDFRWREFDDEDDPEDGVFLSDDDGATWHEVWSFQGDLGETWQHARIDIDTEAALNGLDLHDHFQIKFQFRDNYSIDSDGYAIDEVTVQAYSPPTPATLPFYDGFESGELGTSWVADVTREGQVQVSDLYPYNGSYSLLLDDGGSMAYSLAMVTVVVDLSSHSQIELDFRWREFDDEDHPEDGVFLSDDDGAAWHQALSFNGDHGTSWQQVAIDLDAAAAAAGLALNDHFQIKFQFYDNVSIDSDGYAIDEVQIRPITPASFPYYDGFESGTLGDEWSLYITDAGRGRVESTYPYSGSNSLLLDSSGDQSHAAAILNVDLSEQPEAVLDFWWREFEDEDDPEDGVFLSDDRGGSWQQALSFNGDHGDTWQQAAIDLNAAAAAAGLTLNDHFQIKFQFYDNASIDTDGYAIDEVRLRPNAAPALYWSGDAGYEADGLEPESGHQRTTYVYRVSYADRDGDPPASVQVHIKKGGTDIADSPFTMGCSGSDYVQGVVCTHDQEGLEEGDNYTYFFSAEDDQGNPASSTSELNAPDVVNVYWAYPSLVLKNVGPPAGPPELYPIDNPDGNYKFTVSWSEVERATNYTLEEDTDSTFPSPETAYSGSTTSTQVRVGGTGTYYYRVRASNSRGSSGWSNVQSTQVTVPPPPCPETGYWEGITSWGNQIYFTVSDTPRCQVENLTVYHVICGQKVRSRFNDTYPITNDHFEAGGGQNWVKGDFTSDTTAEGEYQFYMMCPGYPPYPDFSMGDWAAEPETP